MDGPICCGCRMVLFRIVQLELDPVTGVWVPLAALASNGVELVVVHAPEPTIEPQALVLFRLLQERLVELVDFDTLPVCMGPQVLLSAPLPVPCSLGEAGAWLARLLLTSIVRGGNEGMRKSKALEELGMHIEGDHYRLGTTKLTAEASGVFVSIYWPGGSWHLPADVSAENVRINALEGVRPTMRELEAIIKALEEA